MNEQKTIHRPTSEVVAENEHLNAYSGWARWTHRKSTCYYAFQTIDARFTVYATEQTLEEVIKGEAPRCSNPKCSNPVYELSRYIPKIINYAK